MDTHLYESNPGISRRKEAHFDFRFLIFDLSRISDASVNEFIRIRLCSSVVKLLGSLACFAVFPLQAAEVARVGETVITSEIVRETVARQGYNVYEEASIKKALNDAVRFELLAAEAKRLGLDKDPETQRRIKELLVDRLLRVKAGEGVSEKVATDAELLAYYETHTNDFRRPTVVRGPVLTIYLREGQEEAARQKAADALREWKAGEPVESVLRKYSDDPGERVGGIQGNAFIENQPSRRYPEAVAQAMFSLKLRGEVAAPVETPRALYLVGLNERINGGPQSFDQVKRDIKRTLAQAQHNQADAAYSESLKKQFPVVVNETELNRLLQQVRSDKSPPAGPTGTP